MNSLERNFSQKITAWYLLNKRDLPWRNTDEPYKIWLSEIILQQTRVAQGLPYYLNFIETFPTLKDLAKAEEQTVLKLWQGLGYYSRARNMHHTAKYIYNELNEEFPKTYNDLIKLKGVGDYTASAISSFCYNEIQPVIDGNVYRVIARYFGITTPINTAKAKKVFKDIAFNLIALDKPGLFNQAIMEFGSLQCTPKKPNCGVCPVNDTCVALQKNQIAVLPKKKSKLKIKTRHFNYLVLENEEQQTIVNKRLGKGIWQNLYEFPLVETQKNLNHIELIEHIEFSRFVGENYFFLKLLTPKTIVHKLSHQHLHIKFWLVKTKSINGPTISWERALRLPFPIVIFSFIERFLRKKSNFVS